MSSTSFRTGASDPPFSSARLGGKGNEFVHRKPGCLLQSSTVHAQGRHRRRTPLHPEGSRSCRRRTCEARSQADPDRPAASATLRQSSHAFRDLNPSSQGHFPRRQRLPASEPYRPGQRQRGAARLAAGAVDREEPPTPQALYDVSSSWGSAAPWPRQPGRGQEADRPAVRRRRLSGGGILRQHPSTVGAQVRKIQERSSMWSVIAA